MGRLRVGMWIRTNDASSYIGLITAFNLPTSISVDAWTQPALSLAAGGTVPKSTTATIGSSDNTYSIANYTFCGQSTALHGPCERRRNY